MVNWVLFDVRARKMTELTDLSSHFWGDPALGGSPPHVGETSASGGVTRLFKKCNIKHTYEYNVILVRFVSVTQLKMFAMCRLSHRRCFLFLSYLRNITLEASTVVG